MSSTSLMKVETLRLFSAFTDEEFVEIDRFNRTVRQDTTSRTIKGAFYLCKDLAEKKRNRLFVLVQGYGTLSFPIDILYKHSLNGFIFHALQHFNLASSEDEIA